MKFCILPAWTCLAMCLAASASFAQAPLSIDQPPAYEPSADAPAEVAPMALPLDRMPRPCPPGSNACPPEDYPESLVPINPRRGEPSYFRGWLFRRYAGSYEMETKVAYPPGYYGNYTFRPWAPGYVRQTPADFSHGQRSRPFYHHVEFYPHEADKYLPIYEAKRRKMLR